MIKCKNCGNTKEFYRSCWIYYEQNDRGFLEQVDMKESNKLQCGECDEEVKYIGIGKASNKKKDD